jgi:hypothetical protein
MGKMTCIVLAAAETPVVGEELSPEGWGKLGQASRPRRSGAGGRGTIALSDVSQLHGIIRAVVSVGARGMRESVGSGVTVTHYDIIITVSEVSDIKP